MADGAQNSVHFSLFAPYNQDVVLVGSWNGWEPTPMTRDDRGVWRVDVPLADGDYEYKFELTSLSFFASGQRVSVADPVAAELTLDANENSIVRVRDGQRVVTTYEWKHNDVPLPNNEQLVIYEMHIGDFRGGSGDSTDERGTFASAIDKLDYLVELGINAVELMPVNEFPGDYSWGYNLRSIYAVENSYGTPNDLCRFVDECHARGIRVIVDAVYNHMAANAPLTQIDYAYWFYEDNPDPQELDFGPKFNYEHRDGNLDIWPAREYVMGAMRHLVDTYHIDGIRFDCTRAIRYFDLLSWFHHEMHSRVNFKPFYTIAEHVPQDPAVAGPNGPMDAAWHEHFSKQLMCTVLGVPKDGREPFDTAAVLSVLDGRSEGFAGPFNTIHYIDNHDQDRIMWQLGEHATTFDEAAFRRMKLGATLLLTAPGIPMVWMGQEFGQATPKSMEARPLDWGLLNNNQNEDLMRHYAHLIHLRKTNAALCGHHFEVIVEDAARGIIGFKRWSDGGDVIVVVANLKDAFAGDFEIAQAGLEDGVWHETVYNYDVHVQGGALRDSLAESNVKVYIKQPG